MSAFRFLLIGLDGLEPSLVERWMAEGCLPHMAALRKRGSFLRVRSTTPAATFPAWTTCVTGVNPGRHGVFDFTEMMEGDYGIRFVNSTYRRAPALWEILSKAERRVGVLGVPGTYPPEMVNGFMVSGFDSPVATGIDTSFVYPRDVYEAVKGWRFGGLQESHIDSKWHARMLPLLLKKVEEKAEIACGLLAREAWDFFMVVFGESDTVAHHFWMFHDENSPRHTAGLKEAIREVYVRLDAAVGKLAATAGEDMVVGVVSDHGFGGAGTGVIHLNNWLAEAGYLSFAPTRRNFLKEAALSWTPSRLRGALFRQLQSLVNRVESRSRFGGIDWGNTQAWSEELDYFPSIRINLSGREPQGQVPKKSHTKFIAELCAQLEKWEWVAHAWPRSVLYDGPYVERAPDIIIEPALEDGYRPSCLRSRGGKPFRRLSEVEYKGGKERGMNGTHRPWGTLLLSEPTNYSKASLLDIAPTVLGCLGVAGPPMEGRSLLAKGGAEIDMDERSGVKPYSKEEEERIEARLRALGYLE